MKRIVAMIGNGKIYIAADEDLEVLFFDREGEYIEIVPADPERLRRKFKEHVNEQVEMEKSEDTT